MLVVKLLLVLLLAIAPVNAILALPLVSPAAVVAVIAFWLLVPAWGPWLYVGTSLGLMQWRAWQLHVRRLRMSTYVHSPSMMIQNSASMWLSIGGVIGAVRSFVGGDFVGVVLGGLVAVLLFGLQGVLFPNQRLIWQVCGGFALLADEVEHLLKNLDYQTVLRFNRQARKGGISPKELARVLNVDYGQTVEGSTVAKLSESGKPPAARRPLLGRVIRFIALAVAWIPVIMSGIANIREGLGYGVAKPWDSPIDWILGLGFWGIASLLWIAVVTGCAGWFTRKVAG